MKKFPQPQQAGTQKVSGKFPFNASTGSGAGYAGSGDPSSTQDRNAPIEGTDQDMVNPELFIRTIDRSEKTALTLQTSIIAAESVYYPNQQRLFDLYEEVLRDIWLRGIINKRIAQVVNKTLLFTDEEGENIQLEYISKTGRKTNLIKTRAFKEMCKEILWTKFWGVNGMEFVPGSKLKYNLVPKKHIKIKTQVIAYEQFGLTEGVDYTKLANVWILGDEHVTGGNGSSHDLGMLAWIGFLTLLKKGVISDWAQYIQIFGSPALIVSYNGIDRDAKTAAEEILRKLGGGNRMAKPKEMDVVFEDGKATNGDGELQDKFRKACNEELLIYILGNTETSGHSGTGTGAKSKTHSEQQLELIKDDMDYLVDHLNSDQFLSILESYGFNLANGAFEFDKEVDIAYLVQKSPIDIAWVTAGAKVSKKYISETYSLPEPEGPDDVFEYSGNQVDEDALNKPPQGKPTTKKKPQPQALSAADVSAMLDEKLTAFFGPAR